MAEKEYFKLPYKVIPSYIQQHYNLDALQHNQHVYVQVNKGMYGLQQVGILTYNQLVKYLAPYGFHPVANTPGRKRIF